MPAARKTRPDKSASRPVTINLPGAGRRTLPAGDAVRLATDWLKQGRVSAVIPVLRELTAQLPGYQPAWVRLFDALNRAGDFNQLLQATEICLKHKPRSVPGLVSQSIACRSLDRYEQALQAIEKAVKAEPSNPEVLNHYGVLLKAMGDQDKALEVFNRCLKVKPDLTSAIWNRSDLIGVLSSKDYQYCDSLAEDPRRPERQRAMLHYALARSCERDGEFESEAQHILKGAELMRSVVQYDHAAEMAQLQDIPGVFSDDSGQCADPEEGQVVPVFICGLPRSGTTLVEQILSSHPLVMAGDELNDLPLACSQVLRRQRITEPFPQWAARCEEPDWQSIGNAYLKSTRNLHHQGFFTDKNLQNYKAIGVIRRALPQARIIICRRDPMDNLWGCLRQYFSDGLVFTYDQTELAETWNAADSLITHWRSTGVPMLEVSYEALVRNPETIIRELVSFVGLPWDDACLTFYNNPRAVRTTSATQVRQPLSDNAIGRWKRYKDHLGTLQQALKPGAIVDELE